MKHYHSNKFSSFAKNAAYYSGHPIAFGVALGLILAWVISGPTFGYSDTWQLVINTATTIITFLMVFLIQNSQNRDSHAMQIKLDELIRAVEGAHNTMLDLEELTDAELIQIRKRYLELARIARDEMKHGGKDTDCPNIEEKS